jgi:flagellar assembly protein FliH
VFVAPPAARLPKEIVDALRKELEPSPASELPVPDPEPPAAQHPEPPAAQHPEPPAAQHPEPPAAQHPGPPALSHPEPAAAPRLQPELAHPASLPPDSGLVVGLCGAIEQLVAARAEVLATTAEQVAELAVMIARRVIARELTTSPSLVHELVREGLDALGEHEHVLIRLGSGFSEIAPEIAERLLAAGHRAEVRAEPNLSPHACIVETDLGSVDESIEQRLATLLQAIKPDSSAPI